MKAKSNIAGIILAAGESSRMKQIKQLMPWKDTTLLGNAIIEAKNTYLNDLIVVVGSQIDKIMPECIKHDVAYVENFEWSKGMGRSIAVGVNYLLKQGSTYDGILISLGDQPFIDSNYLNNLIDVYRNNIKGIVGTVYKNGVGVPAIFDQTYFMELSQLDKNEGAKSIIKNNGNDVFKIQPLGKEIDLDTLDAYNKAIKNIN